MSTITIPKKLAANGDLIVIPRKDYEKLLRISKNPEPSTLYRELLSALSEVKSNKIFGPFFSAKEMKRSLER